ncbi:MAG: PepSY domain-containing protein, partial [Nitrospirales bacterium]
VFMNRRLISPIFHQGGCIMKRLHTFALLGASALLLTSVGLAMSNDGKEKVAVANLPTSVTMEDAIKTATTQFPGRVLEAELESEDGQAVYEIEIVNASGETREFEIDAQSGKILSSELEDQDEHEKEASDKDSEKS